MSPEGEIRTPELLTEKENYGFHVVYDEVHVCKFRGLNVPQGRGSTPSILSVWRYSCTSEMKSSCVWFTYEPGYLWFW